MSDNWQTRRELQALASRTHNVITGSGITHHVQLQGKNAEANVQHLTAAQVAALHAVGDCVEDSIVDGHTTIAPSGNAVFDALALKLATGGGTMSGPIAMGGQVISGGARFDFTLPMCLLEKDAAQAIGSGAWTAITFGAGDEISDLLGWHDPGGFTTRITPTKAGYYLVMAQITWGATTGELGGHLLFNGTIPSGYRGRCWSAAPTSQGQSTCIDVVYFDGVNDYVELLAYHSSAGDVNATLTRLWCIRLMTGGATA